ncbi:MAG TPA: PepSY-associated TM helix domain-containing protein [Methylophilaceae bacterium]|nr:PepSY-associated TM helix domain-containing protein [Methylophilaceae bacterium]
MTNASSSKININAHRGKFLRTLRKIHGWLGLWGAVLGLLFGVSGIILNHRAVLKIPAVKMEVSEVQLEMPEPRPTDVKEFTRYLQSALEIPHEPIKPKSSGKADKPDEARFMGKDMPQPERWEVSFAMPQAMVKAEYIAGNHFSTIKREDANIWGFITRMHKGIGANTAWVLLADSIAGALILLSITGVLLWTKMRGSRLVMSGLMGTSIVLGVWFTLMMM